ncbi:MAG: hypothetical protein QXG33_03465 [Candidatus Anstonellales archaeon]
MKTGQASLEYLFTYGWMILIVLGVIALLSYTGFFSSSHIRSESCLFQPAFLCTNHILVSEEDGNVTLKFRLLNAFGNGVKFVNVFGNIAHRGWIPGVIKNGGIIQNGQYEDFEITFTNNPPKRGEIIEIWLKIEYINCEAVNCQLDSEDVALEENTHKLVGRVNTKVE